MVGFISETAIQYRSSKVVQDHGGDGSLHAGDRMPDLDVMNSGGAKTTLLADWKEAKHLAIVLDASDTEKREVHDRLESAAIVSLSSGELTDEGRRLLGGQKKLLVVRPDGYVGFRGSASDLAELDRYARQDGISARTAAEAGHHAEAVTTA